MHRRAAAGGHDRAVPGRPRPARGLGARRPGDHRALPPPGRGVGGTARAAATRSSRPAPRAARASPSTCPCSTCSRASRRAVRSTSTRPRRSRRIRRARSSAFGVKGVKPAIYDGDTESERRWQIRKWANVILTNPDMLHVGVLPHHDRWGDVLANLRYVVVDEAHVYRGVFGSHVGERPPPPAAARPRVRVGAAVRARVGDDREPRAAGRVAPRRARDRGRQRRGASDRADDRALEPGADRRRARRPRERARRRVAPARGLRRRGPADDLLREEPQGGRADPPLRLRPARAARWPRGSRRTAPATRRASAARSNSA